MHNSDSNGSEKTHSGPLCKSASSFEHWLTGIVGLGVTLVVAFAVYSTVVSMAHQLQYLSSTAVVFLFFAFWIALWGALEIAWEWRAGRLFAR
jgi:hypothetical protein